MFQDGSVVRLFVEYSLLDLPTEETPLSLPKPPPGKSINYNYSKGQSSLSKASFSSQHYVLPTSTYILGLSSRLYVHCRGTTFIVTVLRLASSLSSLNTI